MDTTLTKEQIATAVRLRVLERKYWEQIAAELGVARSTLWLARRTETWADVALEVVNEIKAEAFPVAWQGLLDAAALKDVAACKEILNRVDKVIEQTLNVKIGRSIETEEERKLLADYAKQYAALFPGEPGHHAD